MDLSILLEVLWCCIIMVKADECVQRNPCSCIFRNGTGIDLTESATTYVFTSDELTFFEEKGTEIVLNKQTYFFHPCYDILMRKPRSKIYVCEGYWSICRTYQRTYMDTGTYAGSSEGHDAVGTVHHSHFASDGSYITYTWPLYTKVYLSCAEGADKLLIRDWDPEVVLQFFSKNACLQQLETPISNPLSIPNWIGVQWSKVSQAVKGSCLYVRSGSIEVIQDVNKSWLTHNLNISTNEFGLKKTYS